MICGGSNGAAADNVYDSIITEGGGMGNVRSGNDVA
jgi:hypothetical protein